MRQKYGCNINELLQHIDNSSDLSDKYREWAKANAKNNDKIDFSIQILTRGSWAFSQCNFSVPSNLDKYVQSFTNFFVAAHTFQMTILLLFNEQTSYTIDQLNEYTGIEMNQLHKQLDSMMVKNKILLKTDNIISINDEFEGPKVRIDIAGKVSFERKPPTQTTEHRIELDRQSLMETIIVRIMKSKKTSTDIDLVAQLLSDLDKRFQPKPSLIKRTIERLVDKDYLERDKNNQSIYHYKA